jgi:hypothetical protein
MMTNDLPAGTARPVTADVAPDDRGYVDWAAIVAGGALAAAISLVLLSFGSAIGLGITSPLPGEGVSFFWFAIAAGLWLLWVQVSSFMAGGYLAGRLRRRVGAATEDEVDMRDGSHGLLVWAVGTLVGAVMLTSGVMGAAQTTVQAAGATAGAAASTVADEGGDAFSGYLADTLFRAEQPATSQAAQRTREEVGRIIAQSVANGELAEEDRAYIVEVVAAQTGVEPAEVEARVADAEQQIVAMRDEALEAADRARQIGVLAAFLVAASLLVSAAGAYFAAGVGGRHRDEGTIIPRWRPAG